MYDAITNSCNYKWGNEMKRWKYRRTKIAYIPSERNLVAAIPNWYQVSLNNNNILDFMKEWEFARKSFPKKEKIVNLPFSYRYNPGDMADRIVMEDGQELNLTNASSGLQSLTPLYVMLCCWKDVAAYHFSPSDPWLLCNDWWWKRLGKVLILAM